MPKNGAKAGVNSLVGSSARIDDMAGVMVKMLSHFLTVEGVQ